MQNIKDSVFYISISSNFPKHFQKEIKNTLINKHKATSV